MPFLDETITGIENIISISLCMSLWEIFGSMHVKDHTTHIRESSSPVFMKSKNNWTITWKIKQIVNNCVGILPKAKY